MSIFLGRLCLHMATLKLQRVSTKHKHTSSAGLHKLTVRSTRLPVTPDTSETSNLSTGWHLREILIFLLIWLSAEGDLGVSHELDPTKASGDSFILCHWYTVYTLWFIYMNWMDSIASKWKSLALSLHRSVTFALWHHITHLDNGKAAEEKHSL